MTPLAVAVLVVADAAACSVCGGGRALNDRALIDMTVVMSLLPLGLIGGLSWYVWRAFHPPAQPRGPSSSVSSPPM